MEEAFKHLRDLHVHDYGEEKDHLRSTATQVAHLGETNRNSMREYAELTLIKNPNTPQEVINAEIRRRARSIMFHHFGYSTSPDQQIKALPFREVRTGEFLEECVRDYDDPSHFANMGMVLTDTDGLSEIKKCVGHDGTNDFLQELSTVLTSAQTPTNARLREIGIRYDAIVAGGDEFLVILTGNVALTRENMMAIVEGYEQDTMNHTPLRAMIDFDNPIMLEQYADRNDLLEGYPEETHSRILEQVRNFLPPKLVPSITGSEVLLTEGLTVAQKGIADIPSIREAQNFKEAIRNISRTMFLIGESRLNKRKKEFKAKVAKEDPLQAAFLDRTQTINSLLKQAEEAA